MYILNGGMLFSAIWMVVKPWLDEKTVKKISIISSGYEKELLELIPA